LLSAVLLVRLLKFRGTVEVSFKFPKLHAVCPLNISEYKKNQNTQRIPSKPNYSFFYGFITKRQYWNLFPKIHEKYATSWKGTEIFILSEMQ